jgi:TonB family protein
MEIDDDPTPPQGIPLPPRNAASVFPAGPAREVSTSDGRGVMAGFAVTLVVHLLVALTSLRLGRNEGNVAASNAPQAPEQIIETQLMKRGGGDLDPRRIVHRQTPTLAEREAPREVALTRDPTAVQLPPDAGAEDYANAIVTGRRRAARGNQDLAELERIAQMAAAEQASDPTAPPGPGDPTGDNHGTTTDPALASRGAVAKLQSFFYSNIHNTTTLSGSERSTITIRVTIDATGQITSARLAHGSGNDALDADVLVQVQALVERNARVEALTQEERDYVSLGGRGVNVSLVLSRL